MPSGKNISKDSRDPIPAGDYAIIVSNWDCLIRYPPKKGMITFKEMRDRASVPNPEHKYRWYKELSLSFDPPDAQMGTDVTRRDGRRCLITGLSHDEQELTVAWVYPPFRVDLLQDSAECEYEEPEDVCIQKNAMWLCKDLADAYLDNAFGIDVDDDYRIVVFRDFGESTKLLQGSNVHAYFRRPEHKDQFDGPEEYFLREHFVQCLHVNLRGGHITDDHRHEDIVKTLWKLGVLHHDDIPASDDHPDWKTDLGKEILRAYKASKILESRLEQSTNAE